MHSIVSFEYHDCGYAEKGWRNTSSRPLIRELIRAINFFVEYKLLTDWLRDFNRVDLMVGLI